MINHKRRDNARQSRYSKTFLLFVFLTAVMLVAVSGKTKAATSPPKTTDNYAEHSNLSKCKIDLADRLNIQVEDIKLVNVEGTTWTNTALGMPEIGKIYADVQTKGSKLYLEAHNRIYLYTTSAKTFKYGGPISIWAHSMLYIQFVKNDLNLNGNLYQCSLLGTNRIHLASGVSDYYPQDDGIVVIKRGTSRSGHDLLYIKVDEPKTENMLYRGMDFGDTALDLNHDRWAGYVKPTVGAAWTVVTGQPVQNRMADQTLPLPEGTKPEKIAWSLDNLMVLVRKDDRLIAFETNPKTDSPTWKPINIFDFPGQRDFILSKSESLVIEQIKEDDKPVIEIACVWFTGDRNIVAKISRFIMRGCDLLGPYAIIWGEKDGRQAVYSVDIGSGVSVVGLPGKVSNIKPLDWPPHDSPVPKAPRMD